MKKRHLITLAMVMIINSLSYGILIPLLYPFASRFGMGPVGLAMLTATYSIFQFVATPIIGRLSDRVGRRPMLILSLLGTAISLALFALSNSIPMLFISRILDGITGGNNSVAQSVIADTTSGEERTKAFGVLGAAFGVGFIIGPIVGAVLSPFGLTIPFWFASGMAIVSTIMAIFLPETLDKKNVAIVKNEPLFDFNKLFSSLFIPVVGATLLLSFISTSAHTALVIGFQSFIVDVLSLSVREVTLLFASIGVVSIFSQLIGLRIALKLIPNKTRLMQVLCFIVAIICIILPIQKTWVYFWGIGMLYAFFFSPQGSVITGIISEATRAEDQGVVLGINQSYFSLGQIVGPLAAGVVVGIFNIEAVFWTGAVFFGLAILIAEITKRRSKLADF